MEKIIWGVCKVYYEKHLKNAKLYSVEFLRTRNDVRSLKLSQRILALRLVFSVSV